MRKCPRCGQTFEVHHVADRYCPPCHRDVTAIIAADEERRSRRVWRAKVLTDWSGRAA